MDELKGLFKISPLLAIAIGLSILGGVVRGVNCPLDDFTWWGFWRRVLSAAFVGCLVWFLCDHFSLADGMKAALTGGSGYAAIDLLKCLTPWIKRQLKIEEESK